MEIALFKVLHLIDSASDEHEIRYNSTGDEDAIGHVEYYEDIRHRRGSSR